MNTRQQLGQSHRWVIKIGSALLTNDGRGLDKSAVNQWVEQIATLRHRQTELILVSSGAIAEGMQRLNWSHRPLELHKLQAAAAVGQMGLIEAYQAAFQQYGIQTAQILLTHDDLAHRERYLNARSTLNTLVELGVIPIINENDTVATEEIRFGDNDTLAGLVTNLVDAELLVLLTDQQGLYEHDPRADPMANLVMEGYAGDPELEKMASDKGGALGRGGMKTKLRAATYAARSGAATWIAAGRTPQVLLQIAAGQILGTVLLPRQARLTARKQWLASHLKMHGSLYLDQGAVDVLRHSGKSLLPIGVVDVEGQFKRGDMVVCIAPGGEEVAKGLVNYDIEEIRKILRQPSDKIAEILGYIDVPELIHRDNLVLL